MNKSFLTMLFVSTSLTTMAEGLPAHSPETNMKADSLNEVVVTGTRSIDAVGVSAATVKTINHSKLTENQRTSILPTLMEQVPGLMITSRGVMGYGVSTGGSGGMMMRGLSSGSGQVMVLIDGHPQYQGVFGHSIADAYQTMMVDHVEVLRGPASVLYGSNAMGGVVNIITRKLDDQKEDNSTRTGINLGAGSYGTIQGEAYNQTRVGRFTSTVAAQYGRSDNHRPNMGFEQFGGFIRLGYDINQHWNLFGDLNMTHFNASNPGTVGAPMIENDQYITRGSANIVLQNKYRNTNGAISIYDNFGRHKINDGYSANGGTPQTELFRSRDAVEGVSWYQTYTFLPSNTNFKGSITAGIDYQHIYGRAWYTSRETGETITTGKRKMQSTHAHENEVAGYVDYRQQLGRLFTLNAGLRYDHHSQAGGEWIPQFGLARKFNDGEMKVMVSKGFRNPTNKEMYLYGTANHDSLYAERMWNYELSWHDHLLNNRLNYGINVFYTKGDNMIQTVKSEKGTFNMNTGKFENMGVELEADYKVNEHWTLNANYSYLHMQTPLIGAPRHKAYLGTTMQYGRWSMAAGLQQINGLYTSVGNNAEIEDFTLLNLTLGYKVCQPVRLWLKGDNLLGQHYQINAGYPMPKATFMAGVNVEF